MELKDSMTVCFIPFSLECDNVISIMNGSLWELIEISVDKSFLYPHISKFLFDNFGVKDEKGINLDNCLVYSLKEDWHGIVSEKEEAIRNLFNNYTLELKTKQDGKETTELKYYFRLLNKSMLSPKLVLHPLSSVGFLMFCFEADERSLQFEDYINLNYYLHKTGKQSPAIRIDKNNENNNKIYSSLRNYNRNNIKPSKKEDSSDFFYLYNLVSFLLHNFDGLTFLNKENMHLFSYIQINSKDENALANDDITNNYIMKNYIRLARCQNTKYMVRPESDSFGDKIYMQTFENIYIASCVEGGCIMTDLNHNSPSFMQDFKTAPFASRYLWTYMLVYLQRIMLLNLSARLTNINLALSDSKGAVTDSLLKLSKMKANTYFTDISDITQHNLFYRFCSQNLSIRQHFDEVRDKIEDLDIVIKEQELVIKEQELEIRNKELKQIEEAERNEAKRTKDLSNKLGFICIAQVFFAFVAFSGANVEIECLTKLYNNFKLCIDIVLAVFATIALVFSLRLIYSIFRKK
ncbi:MAG: hypothetical protein LBR26_02740 [Prevotella sp.]|jgi:hypothetical protein|nr:hypothetical protein [Prevotella sp.]